MSAIKDIVDLAKELETRAKDRKDLETITKIYSLINDIQGQLLEMSERQSELSAENTQLKQKIAESEAEDIRIEFSTEFRRGKRTGNKWQAFCPKCHMPVGELPFSGRLNYYCTAGCGWRVVPNCTLDTAIQFLSKEVI